MLKRFCLIIIGILCGFPVMGFGAERVQVMVLPFAIFAQQNMEYLKDQVPQLIQRHMERDGAIIVKADMDKTSGKEMTPESIRLLGSQKNADVVIWGSLTWLGQNFSLDASMIDVTGDKAPASFFSEGEGIENLPAAVKSLSDAISSKLFKREKIADIRVSGNRRIEQDAIKRIAKTQPGDMYLPKNVSDDLKAIYSMGYFDDVRVESEDGPAGKIIIFVVKEKPTIRQIYIKGGQGYQDPGQKKFQEEKQVEDVKPGALVIEEEKILKSLDIKTGSIVNIYKIQSNVKRIEDMYKEKNYHNVKVTYHIREQDNNQADIEFIIDEGKKILIKEIQFVGNQAYPAKKLKKIMKTSEKGFWSWLTSSGDMKAEDLNQDVELLTSFYQNNGYIQAKVGEPAVETKDNWIFITIKIDEGQRYKVGTIKITGDLLVSEDELMKKIKLSKQEYFSRQTMRDDIIIIGDSYSDEGYAYADVIPRVEENTEKLIVNITYTITKNQLVYFEGIKISGNTKTRDKVIRRELDIYEQELFNGQKLKRGIRNLNRLDYFEDIKVNTNKGSEPDKMVLDIDVKEKPTGTFSFGGGYSSVENMFVVGSVSQRNLFGRGQMLRLKAEIGGRTTRYDLSFTEPWLFDIPLSAGFDLYNQDRDYDAYDLKSNGAVIRFGYPIYNFTRYYISYLYDISDMSDLDENASAYLRQMEGENTTSSVTQTIRYDSRDKVFNPTEGSNNSISVEYAGLGGTVGYTKTIGEAGRYFPLFWSTIGFLHAKGGYISEHEDKLLPPYDRFYIGGINSIRGFKWDELGPKDENGYAYGGVKYVQFNVEYIFPLIKDIGLMGVLFFDTGDLYDSDQDIDLGNLRETAGFGVRWYSPLGPIRIENGFILDPKPGESQNGRWEFTMGQAF